MVKCALFIYRPGGEFTLHGEYDSVEAVEAARLKAVEIFRERREYENATEAWIVKVLDRGNKLITVTWHKA